MAQDTPAAQGSTSVPAELKDPVVDQIERQTARIEARAKLAAAQQGALAGLTSGVQDGPTNTVTFGAKAGSLAPWLVQDAVADIAVDIAARAAGALEAAAVAPPPPAAPREGGGPQGGVANLKPVPGGAGGGAPDPVVEPVPVPQPVFTVTEETVEGDHTVGDAATTAAAGPGARTLPPADQTAEPPAAGREGAAAAGRHVVFVTDDPDLLTSDMTSLQVLQALTSRTDDLETTVARIGQATSDLEDAVEAYRKDEVPTGFPELEPGAVLKTFPEVLADETGAGSADEAKAGEAAAAKADEPAAVAGAMAAAVDLVNLLAVDYTVAAADVTADSALLARLSAANLGRNRPQDLVLLDGYALADRSPTLDAYSKLLAALVNLEKASMDLAARAAPVTAAAAVFEQQAATAKEQWLEASKPPEGHKNARPAVQIAALEAAYQRLEKSHLARVHAAAPATKVVELADDLAVAVRADLAALLTAGATGVSSLQRACSRDRLRADAPGGQVSHILLVQATHAGGDIVTRRSVLGASGRVGYLAGANGAWVMIHRDGGVVDGGAVEHASHLTHDLGTGESMRGAVTSVAAWTSKDPMVKNERSIRVGVLLLAVAIALMSVAAAWSVFFQK